MSDKERVAVVAQDAAGEPTVVKRRTCERVLALRTIFAVGFFISIAVYISEQSIFTRLNAGLAELLSVTSSNSSSASSADTCTPVCVPDGDGAWVGTQPPLLWNPNPASSPPRCVSPVDGVVDLLRIFSGQRLIFTGDSVTRNEVVDFVNLAYDCGYVSPAARSAVLAPSQAWRAAWTIPKPNTSADFAVYEADRKIACKTIDTSYGWHSSLYELRLPVVGYQPLKLEFRWEPYVEMLPKRNDWFKDLATNHTTVRGIVVGAFAWAGFEFEGPGDPVYRNATALVGSHMRFITSIANSPVRDRVFFRSQPVMERGIQNTSMVSTDGCLKLSNDIAATWQRHHPWAPVIDMRGFSRAEACTGTRALGGVVATNISGGICLAPLLTADGHHPQAWLSGPRMQATFNAIVSHSCHRRPSPSCEVVCP